MCRGTMIHRYLFMSDDRATDVVNYEDPTFELYESEHLQSVGLCDKIQFKSFPRFLPRPFNINSAQATAVRLALIQYFDAKGWKKTMDMVELVTLGIMRRSCPNKKTAGGFVIGDGTGVGKTRELAAFLVSVVLYEKAMRDTRCQLGPSIFGASSCEVINAIRDGSWNRCPCFLWLTCSKTLFSNCQDGIQEVITNSKGAATWKPFPDKPSQFKGGGKSGSVSFLAENIASAKSEEVYIRFYTLQDVKDYVKENRGSTAAEFFTAAPTILFMTYADLNANLEFVLKFATGGSEIDSNVAVPVDNFITAVLCDEFHQTKNISDAFRGELERMWAEEDKRVLSNSPRPPNPSVSELVGRFKVAFSKDKLFNAKRFKTKKGGGIRSSSSSSSSSAAMPTTSMFLNLLRQSDSFRLFLEVIKYDSFCVMSSATPFQSNADLHLVDHILRKSIPAYTSIASFAGIDTPDAIAENSEYTTLFLEQAVKLLKNRGQLVSRCISIANVECSVVNCYTTPLQKYALDELSSYCLNTRQVLIDCKELGEAIADLVALKRNTTDDFVSEKRVEEVLDLLNSSNTLSEEERKAVRPTEKDGEEEEGSCSPLLRKMDKRFTAILVHENDVAHDGTTTVKTVLEEAAEAAEEKITNEMMTFPQSPRDDALSNLLITEEEEEEKTAEMRGQKNTDHVFQAEWFKKLIHQYLINIASVSVAACKGALLSVKAHSAVKAIERLRLSPEPKKTVISFEQTGDSFLAGLASRLFSSAPKNSEDHRHEIVDVNAYDSSPLANTILAGYRLLCRAVVMATATKLKIGPEKKIAYLMLVPALPPVEPLIVLSGNSLDTIVQHVGEASHAEITNRKLCSRITERGMMIIRSNHITSNTDRCVDSFNNTKTVDVMMLGPKGNTGLSLHDSKYNAVSAKRIHCLLDVPYDAISFLQTIGRTHRNGQMSVPHFLIFSTDSPSERRFFDSLENRVKDSKAGTFADRYSSNSIRINNNINREQFLDKGLVLKTVGYVIRIITSDMTQVELMEDFSKMMLPIDDDHHGGEAIAFVEGLDSTNDLFVEILLLSIHITLAALGQEQHIKSPDDLRRACNFVAILKTNTIYSVATCAAKFTFSNFCLNLAYHEQNNTKNKTSSSRLEALADAVVALISGLKDNDDDYHAMKNKSSIHHIVSAHRPVDMNLAITSSLKVVTVRILGIGKKEGVITADECQNLPTTDMIQLMPVVAASSVVNILRKENPGLLFELYNAAVPHQQFRGPFLKTAFLLSTARRLAMGSLDFRQFQNIFFSPRNESRLVADMFSIVKSIMARDDRLDGLCETRMNSVMGASYVNVRRKPVCVFISRLLDPVLRRHVCDDEEDNYDDLDRQSGNNNIAAATAVSREGHDLDIVLCNGSSVTLTKENSAFLKEHIDSFIAGNVIGTDGPVLQLCFDNCDGEFSDMPKFCLYDPCSK